MLEPLQFSPDGLRPLGDVRRYAQERQGEQCRQEEGHFWRVCPASVSVNESGIDGWQKSGNKRERAHDTRNRRQRLIRLKPFHLHATVCED